MLGCLLTDLVTAAAKKLSSQFEQCSSVNDSCPSDTSGNILVPVFNVGFFCVTMKIIYNVQTDISLVQ